MLREAAYLTKSAYPSSAARRAPSDRSSKAAGRVHLLERAADLDPIARHGGCPATCVPARAASLSITWVVEMIERS